MFWLQPALIEYVPAQFADGAGVGPLVEDDVDEEVAVIVTITL